MIGALEAIERGMTVESGRPAETLQNNALPNYDGTRAACARCRRAGPRH